MDKRQKAAFFTHFAQAYSSQPVSPSPSPSPEGGDQPELEGCPFYREEQSESRCTLHTANNVLGEGPQSGPYFSAEYFVGFAAQVEWQAVDVDSNDDTSIHDKAGNYGLDIMHMALNEARLWEPEGVRYEIVNVGSHHEVLHNKIEQETARAVVVYRGNHLYCVRRHRSTSTWWNLDTLGAVLKSLTATELVAPLQGEAVGHTDIQLYSVPFLDEADEHHRRVYSRSGPAAPCIGPHERPHDLDGFAFEEEDAISASGVHQEGSPPQLVSRVPNRQASSWPWGPRGGWPRKAAGRAPGTQTAHSRATTMPARGEAFRAQLSWTSMQPQSSPGTSQGASRPHSVGVSGGVKDKEVLVASMRLPDSGRPTVIMGQETEVSSKRIGPM